MDDISFQISLAAYKYKVPENGLLSSTHDFYLSAVNVID